MCGNCSSIHYVFLNHGMVSYMAHLVYLKKQCFLVLLIFSFGYQLKSHPEIYEAYVPMAYGDYLKKMTK